MDATVVDFAVHENGSEYLGIAKCTLPSIANKVVTANGAGIPGDVDVTVIGQTESMRATINFVDNPESSYRLAEPRIHLVDLRVAHEEIDATKGSLGVKGYKHIMELMPISKNSGDVAPASPQGASSEFSVLSIKTFIDDKLVLHIDKLRNIYRIGGENQYDMVAKVLGRI